MVIFSNEVIEFIQSQHYYTFNHVANNGSTNLWKHGWVDSQILGLEGEDANLWKSSIDSIHKTMLDPKMGMTHL